MSRFLAIPAAAIALFFGFLAVSERDLDYAEAAIGAGICAIAFGAVHQLSRHDRF